MQVDCNRRSCRTIGRLHAHDAGLDCKENPRERLLIVTQFETMLPAQVQRNRQRKFDLSIASNFHFRDCLFLRRETVAAHAAPDVRLPEKIQCNAGWKTFPFQHGMGADSSLRWTDAQLSIR